MLPTSAGRGHLIVNGLDISAYFEDCIRAARIFILKEYDDTLPAARRHMNIMWFVDLVVRCLFWGFLIYYAFGWMTSLASYVIGSNVSQTVVTPAE